MSFFDTLTQMLVVLFAMAMGYLADKLGYLDPATDTKLSNLVLNITTPALVLSTVMTGDELPVASEILAILLVGVLFYAMEFLFVLAVPRLVGGTPLQIGVWRFSLFFANIAFIGYPVIEGLYGAEGLFFAVILALPFNLLAYTVGPLFVSGTFRISWKQFVSPGVLAAVAALIIALGRIQVPQLVGDCAALVGQVTIPLSLIVLGSKLAHVPVNRIFSAWRMWVISAFRLLVLPAVLVFLLRMMGIEDLLLNVAVVQMAMPVAVNGTMLCLQFGGDSESMAQVTFLTTVLSIVTIPVVVAFL